MNKLYSIIISVLFLTSCSSVKTTCSRKTIPEQINNNECLPELIFEGDFNAKCKIYLNDTLFCDTIIKNNNYNVIILAGIIKIPKTPDKIEVKIGARSKKIIVWNGRYKYIYITKTSLFEPIVCHISNIKKRYR